MPCFVFQVTTPVTAWCTRLTAARPDLRVRVLAGHQTRPGNLTETIQIQGQGWQDALRTLQADAAVHEIRVLDSTPEQGIVRIAADPCPLCPALEANGINPHYPCEIQAGKGTWMIQGEAEKARALVHALRAHGMRANVVYNGDGVAGAALTARQREILGWAVREGYYAFPRRITLTDLAKKIGIAKSTLSESLMIIESHTLGHTEIARAPAPVAAVTS